MSKRKQQMSYGEKFSRLAYRILKIALILFIGYFLFIIPFLITVFYQAYKIWGVNI